MSDIAQRGGPLKIIEIGVGLVPIFMVHLREILRVGDKSLRHKNMEPAIYGFLILI